MSTTLAAGRPASKPVTNRVCMAFKRMLTGPVAASQTRAVLSDEDDASCWLCGE
jgi:hypothetical protein